MSCTYRERFRGVTLAKARLAFQRFTLEELETIRKMYLAYAPTLEIANVLGCSEGTVRQKIKWLGLRRSSRVLKLLAWAPEHLKKKLGELGAGEFIERCYHWREDQRGIQHHEQTAGREQFNLEVQAQCAAIDAQHNLPRDAKMAAKRLIGMTLEAIGQQHGITRERVRQLTSPTYVAQVGEHKRGGRESALVVDKLQILDLKRQTLIEASTARLMTAWQTAPAEVRKAFLERIGAECLPLKQD